jgi:hypothetical protein
MDFGALGSARSSSEEAMVLVVVVEVEEGLMMERDEETRD